MDKLSQWITTGERSLLPPFIASFAKTSSGGGGGDEDDPDNEEDEGDDPDDEDPDADKSEEDLRAELKSIRSALSKANGQSAKRRKALREREAELEEARKPKKKSGGENEDGPDLDTVRHEARTEGEKAGLARAKKAEAKSSLLAAGVNPERVTKAVGLLDLDDMDLDDDGLDGVDDAIESLRKEWPELFPKKRKPRESVAGERGGDSGSPRRQTKTASELAADKLLGRG